MAVRAARAFLHLLCYKAGGCEVLPLGRQPSSIIWGVINTEGSSTAVACTDDSLLSLLPFFETEEEAEASLKADLDAAWPRLPRQRDDKGAASRLTDWENSDAAVKVLLTGTALQLNVWQALASTAPGDRFSYSELAGRVSRPTAVRAVASCVARNPVSLVIPCHRIVPSSGGVGNYRWGSSRKISLLEEEAQPALR